MQIAVWDLANPDSASLKEDADQKIVKVAAVAIFVKAVFQTCDAETVARRVKPA